QTRYVPPEPHDGTRIVGRDSLFCDQLSPARLGQFATAPWRGGSALLRVSPADCLAPPELPKSGGSPVRSVAPPAVAGVRTGTAAPDDFGFMGFNERGEADCRSVRPKPVLG